MHFILEGISIPSERASTAVFRAKAYVGKPSNGEGREKKTIVKRLRLLTAYLLAPAGAPVSGGSLPS